MTDFVLIPAADCWPRFCGSHYDVACRNACRKVWGRGRLASKVVARAERVDAVYEIGWNWAPEDR